MRSEEKGMPSDWPTATTLASSSWACSQLPNFFVRYSRRLIPSFGIVRERVNLDHHVTGPASEVDRPLAVLLLGQFDAEGLVEEPKLLDLASFQDQKRQRNVGHESTSNAGRRSSVSRP